MACFPEMLEGRIVRERTCRHSDLLARTWRAGGLWSAASGEEVACHNGFDVRVGLALSADWMRPARRRIISLARMVRHPVGGVRGVGLLSVLSVLSVARMAQVNDRRVTLYAS